MLVGNNFGADAPSHDPLVHELAGILAALREWKRFYAKTNDPRVALILQILRKQALHIHRQKRLQLASVKVANQLLSIQRQHAQDKQEHER